MNTSLIFAVAYLFGIAWLLGWEIAAFAVNPRYTISELWWTVEGHGLSAARYATFGILTWLDLHLAFQWFRGG